MMATGCTWQLSNHLGIYRQYPAGREFQSCSGSGRVLLSGAISSISLRQNSWSVHVSDRLHRRVPDVPYRRNVIKCHSFINPGCPYIFGLKNTAVELTRYCGALQSKSVVLKLVPAVTLILFAVWGLEPIIRLSRNIFLRVCGLFVILYIFAVFFSFWQNIFLLFLSTYFFLVVNRAFYIVLQKNDNSWKKSNANYVMTSYLQPILLWTGLMLICRALDPVVLPSKASEIVKQRLLNFVRSLSTVLAFAYCISSVIQQTQKYFTETSDPADKRNMGFQFAGKAVYTAVWMAAISLFMELLGFSTQRWLTAGGLGTVLLTLAGREIFTNFLSSMMIHATRPFIVNEWIKTKIEGYEVSGTVEHVGWWSPTIIRGDDREAVHIPNHKFTVNVVRNITQKTHWRIKTHLAISHLDVNKINNIVADMRKVLAKNPQVEQQKLHRRVFLESVNPETQALMILISCFVKTSRFQEYLCVQEAILLDLLRVISHHRARLATPIRTVQKIYGDADLDSMPFAESVFTRGRASTNRPLLLIEPSYKINGEEKTKSQTRSARTSGDQPNKAAAAAAARTSDNQVDVKGGQSDAKYKKKPTSDSKENADSTTGDTPNSDSKEDQKNAAKPVYDTKSGDKAVDKTLQKSAGKAVSKSEEISNSNSGAHVPNHVTENNLSENRSSTSSPKQSQRSADTQAPASRPPVLEENIVLGVALDGSKRTLPIEDEVSSSVNAPEVKKLAKSRSGNVHLTADKDMKDNQNSTVPGAAPTDN